MHTRISFIGKNVPLWEPGPVAGRGKSKLFDLTDWSTGSLISATPTRCKRRLLHGSVVLAEATLSGESRQRNSAVKKKGGKKRKKRTLMVSWHVRNSNTSLHLICPCTRHICFPLRFISCKIVCSARCVYTLSEPCDMFGSRDRQLDGFCHSSSVLECPTPCKAQR